MNRKAVIVLAVVGIVALGGVAVVALGAWWLFFNEEAPTAGGAASKPRGEVVINGRALTDSQLETLKSRYGKYPVEGRYWYDPKSGLYGHAGRSADGFMHADHDFGPLARDASTGCTGVFLNGRELAREEYLFFSALAGNWIAQGRYWMDARGDCGVEGNPTPAGNLYQTVQQRLRAGGGAPNGRGDNFWWSRFSAGNSTDDNSAGYVSLPGGGFATYGM